MCLICMKAQINPLHYLLFSDTYVRFFTPNAMCACVGVENNTCNNITICYTSFAELKLRKMKEYYVSKLCPLVCVDRANANNGRVSRKRTFWRDVLLVVFYNFMTCIITTLLSLIKYSKFFSRCRREVEEYKI